MLQRVPKITQDELDAAIQEARRDFGDGKEIRPAGAKSITEWADMIGIGETTMRIRMRRAVAAGKYERVTGRLIGADGHPYPAPMYRKVKQVPNAMDRIR